MTPYLEPSFVYNWNTTVPGVDSVSVCVAGIIESVWLCRERYPSCTRLEVPLVPAHLPTTGLARGCDGDDLPQRACQLDLSSGCSIVRLCLSRRSMTLRIQCH